MCVCVEVISDFTDSYFFLCVCVNVGLEIFFNGFGVIFLFSG